MLEYILKCGYVLHNFNVHFLFYIFDIDLLLAVCFIFILDYENGTRKKANLSCYLFEFKMGHKVAETTYNINNAFGTGTANERTAQ